MKAPTLVAALAVSTLISSPGTAEVPKHVSDYSLTTWGPDAVPSGLEAISSFAQDRDGYLWLGTDSGLIRFDGSRFVEWRPDGEVRLPRSVARSLYASRDGDLWIGFDTGEISRLRAGLRNYGTAEGLPSSTIWALAEDTAGTIWAGTDEGLYSLVGDRWQKARASDGLPDAPVRSLHIGQQSGDLIVGSAGAVFRYTPKDKRFFPVEATAALERRINGLSESSMGGVWVTDPLIGFQDLEHPTRAWSVPRPAQGLDLLHDRGGSVWVAMGARGLWRVRWDASNGGPVADRAGTISARLVFEDRERNIWAAGPDGLHRFTRHRVRPVTSLGLVEALEVAGDGKMWIIAGEELVAFDVQGDALTERLRLPIGARTIHLDANGTLWAATHASVVRVTGGRPKDVVRLEDGALDRITSITSDGGIGLWLFFIDQDPLHWTGKKIERGRLPPGFGRNTIATLTDTRGRVWVASLAGRLDLIAEDGVVHSFGPEHGLGRGPYNAIYEDSRGTVWVGGIDGLSRSTSDGQFAAVTADNGLPVAIVAITEDDVGTLWLGSRSGIIHIDRAEVDRAIASPAYQVRFSVYDLSDGLAGLPLWRQGRNVVHARDGRVWFVTSGGLTAVNPRSLGDAHPPLAVRIEEVLVDGLSQDAASTGQRRLGPGTMALQINYTAFRYRAPQKVRFRYRLEGFDAAWVDAGSRRQAFYTNLPPRKYSFHVMAGDGDGAWSESAATWAFEIVPPFYQTRWFGAISVLSVILVLALLWQLRAHQVRRQFALVLGERVRLSREIHDTLLQSLVGVSLQFEAVARTLEPSSSARERLVDLRNQVEEYIREARRSIWNLRSPILQSQDLPAALRTAGERVVAGAQVAFFMDVRGVPSRESPLVEEQFFRIGQEAILNAVRHARPTRIDVELRYEADAITLHVSDDGCGLAAPAADGPAHGHYGLVGLRERVERVGGTCTIEALESHGTLVRVVVPRRPARKERTSKLRMPRPIGSSTDLMDTRETMRSH